MAKVVLYVAMSLDGYISDCNGKVDWLNEQEENDSYETFIQDIDTIIMGWNTYHQIVSELSLDKWIYEDKTTYVITHRKMASSKSIIFTDEDPGNLIKRIKNQNIWICGGANLVSQLIQKDLIDIYHLTIIPIILGDGIALFNQSKRLDLKLADTKRYGNMVEMIYFRK
ncbi:dihydrofolate reductase family protein [Thomasclavelia sp.]|uniref:dihydrofolate reductase family protein n=1 Tax=Thomasclavelia sp. TaxID=3025757 RepID=UPI0025DAF32C|nr:dihydrofolate reductase family protein [Thomasclavelia sp.]